MLTFELDESWLPWTLLFAVESVVPRVGIVTALVGEARNPGDVADRMGGDCNRRSTRGVSSSHASESDECGKLNSPLTVGEFGTDSVDDEGLANVSTDGSISFGLSEGRKSLVPFKAAGSVAIDPVG